VIRAGVSDAGSVTQSCFHDVAHRDADIKRDEKRQADHQCGGRDVLYTIPIHTPSYNMELWQATDEHV
jgi:hypothetical protein